VRRILPWAASAIALLGACGGGDDGTGDAAPDGGDDVADGADVADAVEAEAPAPSTFEGEVRIEGGVAWTIHIAPAGRLGADPVPDPLAELPDTARSAVDAAPERTRETLARTLWRLGAATADLFAAEILAADARTVDDTAWAIAVTAPELLQWIADQGGQHLFLENAEALHAVDGLLPFARLVDLPDGRTTLELDGEDGTYRLEADDFDWYVVYPRAYFELPAYFGGQFWRTLFRNDARYGQTLVDAVAGALTVQEAADAVGDWIQGFMTFTYEGNLLQPVEIYRERRGSCGEYSILTSSAAKTVLLPTVSVAARADDHEWNELWDGRWIMWDNSLGELGTNPHYPYIDWPYIYDDDLASPNPGVFGEVAHVLQFRADESIRACEQYTELEDVTITVRDGSGNPVEGARVLARSNESGYTPCTWSYTDDHGVASFRLGDDLVFGFTADHDVLGTFPDVGVEARVFTEQGGPPITDELAYPTSYPRRLVDGGTPPAGDLRLSVVLQVLRTEQQRTNYITEGYDLGHTYPASFDGGVIDAFVVDAAGYDAFRAGSPFTAYAVSLAQEDDAVELTLESGRDWYLVLDNAWWPRSTKFVAVSATASF